MHVHTCDISSYRYFSNAINEFYVPDILGRRALDYQRSDVIVARSTYSFLRQYTQSLRKRLYIYILLERFDKKFKMDRKVGRMFVDRTLKLMKQKYPDTLKGEIPGMFLTTLYFKDCGAHFIYIHEVYEKPPKQIAKKACDRSVVFSGRPYINLMRAYLRTYYLYLLLSFQNTLYLREYVKRI